MTQEVMEQPTQAQIKELLEWAVPKVIDYLPFYRRLFAKWLEALEDEPDPTLALSWVLWQVKEKSNEDSRQGSEGSNQGQAKHR